MTNINSHNDSNNNSGAPLTSGPVVFLLLDGWGVAPLSEANAMSGVKTPYLDTIVKEYPVALLEAADKTLNARYLSLGAGCDLSDEAYEPTKNLTQVLSENNLTQIKITETERLAALTHYFNGHANDKLRGEDWNIVSSEAGDHSVKPILALNRITRELIKSLKLDKYNFIIASAPTLDLVAASGDFKAVKKAIEAIDKNLKKIVSAVLDKKGTLIIGSANGNAENMKSMATELVNKEMTDNPVPLFIIGENFKGKTIGLADAIDSDLSLLVPSGNLGDLAPTILAIINLDKPSEMTGTSILDNK